MNVKQVLEMQRKTAKKLMAAIAMMLVATIMMSTVSYAWLIMSSAPEAKTMKTTVGSNGALEIALSSYRSDPVNPGRAPVPHSKAGDSVAAGKSVLDANLTWGNVVDLTGLYGLENVKLVPARINLTENNNVKSQRLKVPRYGEDGRINSMSEIGYVHYVNGDFVDGPNFGVNIMGDPSAMGGSGQSTTREIYNRKRVVTDMAAYVASERVKIYNDMVAKLESNVPGENQSFSNAECMVMIFKKISLQQSNSVSNSDAGTAFNQLLGELREINNRTQRLMSRALMARAAADLDQFPNNAQGQADLEELYSKYADMDIKEVKDKAEEYGYSDIATAAGEVESIQGAINRAEAYNRPQTIVSGIQQLINYGTDFYVYARGTELNNLLAAMTGLNNLISDGKGRIYAANGVFYALAHILGDYEADIRVTDSSGKNWEIDFYVCGTEKNGKKCDPEGHLGYLDDLYWQINRFVDQNKTYGDIYIETESFKSVTAYGYSVDLAFRSSKGGYLALQTTPIDRVTGLTKAEADQSQIYNESTQGLGSSMSFELAADSPQRAEGLLKSIYVVFIDEYNQIKAVATADAVRVDGLKVTARLSLYNYELTDGILRVLTPKSSQRICELRSGQECYLTALVYLNGDSSTAANVSYSEAMSISGSLSMQFCLDGAELTPMTYTEAYKTAPAGQGGA